MAMSVEELDRAPKGMIVWVKSTAVGAKCDQRALILRTHGAEITAQLLGTKATVVFSVRAVCGVEITDSLTIRFFDTQVHQSTINAYNDLTLERDTKPVKTVFAITTQEVGSYVQESTHSEGGSIVDMTTDVTKAKLFIDRVAANSYLGFHYGNSDLIVLEIANR